MTGLRVTRILIRNIFRTQTPTRHARLAIITPIGRNMTPIAQIATPTSLDLVVGIQVVKGGFDLSARHAHRVRCVAVAGEHCSTAVVSVEREEVVDDGFCAR